MATNEIDQMAYEQKEARLEEILTRLDNSETPMDELAAEAKEAAALITSMHATLRSARQQITTVFQEMEQQKDALNVGDRNDPQPNNESSF